MWTDVSVSRVRVPALYYIKEDWALITLGKAFELGLSLIKFERKT